MVIIWPIKGVFCKLLFIIYKNDIADLTYYQRNRNVILNRAKDYYESDQERLREQAREKYRNLSEEEKNKKREYGKNRYHNMSEEKKKRLKEYQKIIARQKSLNLIIIIIIIIIIFSTVPCFCRFL